MRIVLVDSSRIVLKLMGKMLLDDGHDVESFTDGAEAMDYLRTGHPIDVVITSFEIPNISGLELCWEARLISNGSQPIYVIAMSSNSDSGQLIEALDSGADDFVAKPPVVTELYARLRAAERMNTARRELIRLATIDPLTNLPNRRAFFDRATDACLRSGPANPLSLVMFDIDHFKAINDSLGHDAGDLVLKSVAAIIQRHAGQPARLGGEEFAVLLEGLGLIEARGEAERLRIAIQNATIPLPSSGTVSVTVSLGVAQRRPGETVDQILKNADVALYAAKTNGRNRTIAADFSMASMGLPVAIASHATQ